MPDITTLSLQEQCEAIWQATLRHERDRDRLRNEPATVRVWDGEWALHYLMEVEYNAAFGFISNDSGTGTTDLPFDSKIGQWIYDMWGRMERGEKRNVHITVDYCGARWGGRLDDCTVESREDGDQVVACVWLHDYENLKWYACWSNPFFIPGFQAPKVWGLAGPVPWVGLATLQANLIRENNPLLTPPDDLLDFDSYLDGLDMSTWQVVCKPLSLLDAIANGDVWGFASARFSMWHDGMKVMLEDGEYSVDCRRYLDGDPLPWAGANLRHGCLVVDILNKSDVLVGTSHGGTLADGLLRTGAEFAEDFIDSTGDIITDSNQPEEYFLPGMRLTHPSHPYVVYLDGENSGIESSEFKISPAKGVQVIVGGKSSPGVNEAIGATVQAAGDILGSLVLIGSLGGTIDTLIKPLYEDVIAAWSVSFSNQRAQHSGWSRYFEYIQGDSTKAYTIASLMVKRAGFWATKTVLAAQIKLSNGGGPFLLGDRGVGHAWLDDRMGFALENDPTGRLWIDRARKIDLSWDEDGEISLLATIGDERIFQDPMARAWGKLEAVVAGARDAGFY